MSMWVGEMSRNKGQYFFLPNKQTVP